MKIQTNNFQLPQTARKAPNPQPQPEAGDKVEINFDGPRPAHRLVKKISRAAAGVTGVSGLAAAGYALATAPSLETGLVRAGLALAGAGAAIVGMDLVSGMWHHHGDNYGHQGLKHTKWHTNTEATDYCLVGVSNKALDKIGFWPKWEKAVYQMTGKEPLSWQVEPYKNFALGNIDEKQLHSELAKMGMPQ